MFYGVKVTKTESGKFELSCRDLPGLYSEFDTEEEAEANIGIFMPTCLMLGYRKKRLAFPLPSEPQEGEVLAHVPLKVQAKILFWNFLIENGISQAEAARRLGVPQSVVARFSNLSTDSASTDKVEWALKELGGYLSLSVDKR